MYSNTLESEQTQTPCATVQDFGWDLYSTLINPHRPFFEKSSEDPTKFTLPPAGNITYSMRPITAKTNHLIPAAPQVLTKGMSIAYANSTQCFQPLGNALFGSEPLAQEFNSMVAAIRSTGSYTSKTGQSHSKFVSIFRKLQYQILNDLYIYLTALYMNFILTIPKTETKTPSSVDIYKAYADLDQKSDLTNKSLIVSHLINLIQGQMFSVCQSINPLIPTTLTIRTGSILHQNDHSIDPMFLIVDLTRPFYEGDDPNSSLHSLLVNIQKSYIRTLHNVLQFFQDYGNYITVAPNKFLTFAVKIKEAISNDFFNKNVAAIRKQYLKNPNAKYTELRKIRATHNPINPPLLYFDEEMIRSLQILPTLASNLRPTNRSQKGTLQPTESLPIGWPSQIYTLALSNTSAIDNNGAALPFKAATLENNSAQLFIQLLSPRGSPYMQELIKQPTWLDTKDGVIKMMRACLGDFNQLIGLNILDPELEFIVAKAMNKTMTDRVQKGTTQKLNEIYNAQKAYEQDQCKNMDQCCKAATNIQEKPEIIKQKAEEACRKAKNQQSLCLQNKDQKICDQAITDQKRCQIYSNQYDTKNACKDLTDKCGKSQS